MKEPQARVDKKLMEIDEDYQNPSNSIIILSKAFDNGHASKSDPNRWD
jgi:hypothetical protein